MSLKIRLSRSGSKKRPYYHIVIADARSPRDGRFIEKIGFWNPILLNNKNRMNIKKDRAQYWISKGAQPTDRISNFLNIKNNNKDFSKKQSMLEKNLDGNSEIDIKNI